MNQPATTIKRLRRKTGLDQGRFARQLGVSQQTVSAWERGQCLHLVRVALKLARLLSP